MEINYTPFILSAIVLILLGDSAHGPIQTETEIIKVTGTGGWIAWFLNQFAKWTNSSVTLTVMTVPTVALLDMWLHAGLMGYIDALVAPRIWWLIYIPAFNLLSSALTWAIFMMYNVKRFGSTTADYENWPEFQRESHTTHNTTVISMDGQRWSPFKSAPKATLSTRSAARAAKSTRSSTNSSLSTRSGIAVPLPFSVGGNKSSVRPSKSFRSSSKKSGNSDWIKGLGQGIILVLAIAVLVLYCFAAFWLNDKVFDFWDETYVMDQYIEV